MNITTSRWTLIWVYACLTLVFSMVIVGGLTRLTESGLSIVEWKLLSGTLPPLTQDGWEREFAAYRTTPEYLHKNYGMNLAQFQGIFWLEYLHRLLGRVIGLAVLLPLALVWLRRLGPEWFRRRMTVVAILVGLQGTVGWYMVKSGLVDVPWVSPYRLALHLGLAVSLFGLLTLTALRLRDGVLRAPFSRGLPRQASLTSLALFSQIILGAFVAGLDAGMTYNTFPLMDGDFIPAEMRALEPSLRHYLENIASVQFLHRWWAFAVAALVIVLAVRVWQSAADATTRRLALALCGGVASQITLGIFTLLWVVPIGPAALHQAVAVALFGLCVWLNYRLSPQKIPARAPDLISVNPSTAPAL